MGLVGAPEWPALRALLPDPRGLKIADLGWFRRWAAEQEAAHVLGLDVSGKMLTRAAAANAQAATTYARADLERPDLSEGVPGLWFARTTSKTWRAVEERAPCYGWWRTSGFFDGASDLHGTDPSAVTG